jgi:hypothetical protein
LRVDAVRVQLFILAMLSFGNAARKETNLQQDGYHTHTVANTASKPAIGIT